METRGVVAEYDPRTDRYTLTMGTQGGHGMRDRIAKDILNIPASKIRVITPDVGGGFGTKSFAYHEYPLAAIAAKQLGRPVKWIGERSEHFLSDSHGRDNLASAEMAMDENGKFLAMRVDLLANMGAYLSQYAPCIPEGGLTMSTGLYDIPHPRMRAVAASTPTPCRSTPIAAPGGRRRPISSSGWSTSAAATPASVRSRSASATSSGRQQLPYETQGGRIYDSGEFAGHLDRALEVSDWKGFDARAGGGQARGQDPRHRHRHLYRGLRLPRPRAGDDHASTSDGTATLFIGTQTNGQGHATAYSQFIAGHLGLDYDKITVIQGDTDLVAQRRGDRRLALDPDRRGLGRPRGDQARRAGQGARRRAARGRRRRSRDRRRRGHASSAPTARSRSPTLAPRPPRTRRC